MRLENPLAAEVERAIRAAITSGTKLVTPMRGAVFLVEEVGPRGVVLTLGKGKGYATPLSWDCLEGIAQFLRGRDWVKIGTRFEMSSDAGTLDDYLKGAGVSRACATYVAALLEYAGVVEVARRRPAQVRLKAKS